MEAKLAERLLKLAMMTVISELALCTAPSASGPPTPRAPLLVELDTSQGLAASLSSKQTVELHALLCSSVSSVTRNLARSTAKYLLLAGLAFATRHVEAVLSRKLVT